MSRAFTKEDADSEPVVVAPRAPLPPGTPNYVTASGLAALREELARVEAERARVEVTASDADRPRALAALAARLAELAARVARAVLVDPAAQPRDEVRFGATVTVRGEDGEEREFRIVGVDEADVALGRVAFVSPLARALLGKRAGDAVELRTPRGAEELEVVAIRYDEGDPGRAPGGRRPGG